MTVGFLERPGEGVGIARSQEREGPVRVPDKPGKEVGWMLRCRIRLTSAYAFARRDDGRHPGEDTSGMSNQCGSIPLGAVRHQSILVSLGRSPPGSRANLGRGKKP